MGNKDIKTLCTFFIVVILLVCYGWYRTENNRLKQIEKLNDRIFELEEMVESLGGEP